MDSTQATGVGDLIRHWRRKRGMSQLDLALEAEVSTRHLSFLETGRSRPSREMLLLLGSALDVPLRERNLLLRAAGHPPAYRESALDGPELASVRRALDFLLDRHEPYPAVVMDSAWNILRSNDANLRVQVWLGGAPPTDGRPPNLMRSLFDPEGLGACVVNLDELGPLMLGRLRREAVLDPACGALLKELLSRDDLPDRWRKPPLDAPELLVPVVLEKDGVRLSLFSTITTLGTPQDVTLQEIRIETHFPADDATEAILRGLAARQ